MKTYLIFGFVLFFMGCASVPITHRKQVTLVSEYELIKSSNIAYDAFLNENDIINPYDAKAMMVKRVGNNLAEACRMFLLDHGDVERIAGYEWEFNLVNSDEVNAWCMPGGKVVVYSGLLDVTQDESGLATVLSHEIAHAIARHSNERVSQQLLAQVGGSTLEAVLGATDFSSEVLDDLMLQSFSLGSNIGLLKFSRNHESEADKMGLVFMEYAGYDCSKAVGFWERMASQSTQDYPVLLSTHPADASRIRDIEEFIPVAKSYVK